MPLFYVSFERDLGVWEKGYHSFDSQGRGSVSSSEESIYELAARLVQETYRSGRFGPSNPFIKQIATPRYKVGAP
jgi:hypothetical protein